MRSATTMQGAIALSARLVCVSLLLPLVWACSGGGAGAATSSGGAGGACVDTVTPDGFYCCCGETSCSRLRCTHEATSQGGTLGAGGASDTGTGGNQVNVAWDGGQSTVPLDPTCPVVALRVMTTCCPPYFLTMSFGGCCMPDGRCGGAVEHSASGPGSASLPVGCASVDDLNAVRFASLGPVTPSSALIPACGNAGGAPTCPSGMKLCGGTCGPISPEIGCDTHGCAPCPAAPANAFAVCAGNVCRYSCQLGYSLDPTRTFCTVDPSSTTGNVPDDMWCHPSTCGLCDPRFDITCCDATGKCGCANGYGTPCIVAP